MCGEITKVGPEVKDFRVGDRVIVCSVMPVWRSLEAQDGMAKQRQDNLYTGVGRLLCGGILHPRRGHDLARIPEGVSLEQAVMVPDMMCTAFEGVRQLGLEFGASVAVLGTGRWG